MNYVEKIRKINPLVLHGIERRVELSEEQLNKKCGICPFGLGDFGDELPVSRIKKCRHLFHGTCLNAHIAEGDKRCPVCKRDIRSGEGASRKKRQIRRKTIKTKNN